MAGNTEDVRIWTGADLYAADVGTPAPTTIADPLGDAYEPLGLIDQDDAIGEEFSSDDTDHFAYGSQYVRKTSIKQKTSLSLTALENSDLVFHLANPGSDSEALTGTLTKRVIRPKNLGLAIKVLVLEKTDGLIISRLYIPRAQITIAGSRQTSDNEMYGTPLVADILAALDDDDRPYFMTEITNDPAAAPGGGS